MTSSRASGRALLVVASLALSACQQQQAPGPDRDSAIASQTAKKAAPVAAKPDCPPVPAIDWSYYHFTDPRGDFAADGGPLDRTEANFRTAYAAACREGLLAKSALVDPRSANKKTIFLANAPEANVASFYFDPDPEIESKDRNTLLEYHFRNEGAPDAVPTIAELHEAIFCAVHGPSENEQQRDGRCLAD